ncbi:MAG: hypothetical protein IGBAC_0193 [Ignavibacteriae bacterium]|nr:MAG: hypothetical protein IGBAC_0193 [Ignavibacteriota bacterium]
MYKQKIKGDDKMKTLQRIILIALIVPALVYAQTEGRATQGSEKNDVDNVQTIKGTITEVKHPYATFKGEDGKEYRVHLGPQWYWEREKFQLRHNVQAQIKGEVKQVQGRYEFYPWEITQDGKQISLADQNGKPKWSSGKDGKRSGKSGKSGKFKGGNK